MIPTDIYFDKTDLAFNRWTQTAAECYKIGGVCSKCPLYKTMQGNCKMKYVLVNIIRKVGLPKEGKFKDVIKRQGNDIII